MARKTLVSKLELDAALAERDALREQLDAAANGLTLAVEQFDEFAVALDALGHHRMAEAARISSIGTAEIARAVVAAATPDTPPKASGGALGQTAPESRGGDS